MWEKERNWTPCLYNTQEHISSESKVLKVQSLKLLEDSIRNDLPILK